VSSNLHRPSSGRRRVRRVALALAAPLLAAAAIPSAAGAAIEVTSVFAKPVDPTTVTVPQPGSTIAADNDRYLCTPEPRGHWELGTFNAFDITQATSSGQGYPAGPGYPASSPFVAPNLPAREDLTPALQAGANADFCFGFTLTPNMQPEVVRTPSNMGAVAKRLNDPDHPIADDPNTHTFETVSGTRQPVDGDDLKDVTVDLPAGFAGDPDNHPTCSAGEFGLGNYKAVSTACDAAVLGNVYARVWLALVSTNSGVPTPSMLTAGGQVRPASNLANAGMVYNLEHGPSELALLGLAIAPATGVAPAKLVLSLSLTPDGRIRTVVKDAPRAVYARNSANITNFDANDNLLPTARPSTFYLESLAIRIWGAAADHPDSPYTWPSSATARTSGLTRDFAQWGTRCGSDLTATVSMKTYSGHTSNGTSDPVQMTGCSALAFTPSVEVATTETRPGVPTGATVRVNVPQSASGAPLGTAMLRTAKVTLPKGLELGAQVASGAGGLKLCSAAQFSKDSIATNACPAGSSVGHVVIDTPLLDTNFVGDVYLGEQSAVGELPKLYLQAQVEVADNYPNKATLPRIKLVGDVKANDDGTITTTFTDAPQLRFSLIQLTFDGGDHALFVTPRTCDRVTSPSTFTSWAGQTLTTESSLQMTTGCAMPAFGPTIAMSSVDTTAGASSPTTVTVSREDRSPWIKDVKVSLPTGFLADLNVPTECPAAAAVTGACPASSRIATVVTEAGAGDKPLALTGAMYMVERQEGAVAGAAIVVRAKLGDLDLGDVVVPARIDLRPTDAGLTLTTTAPTRFKNLALLLRSIKVTIDREGFPLSPTACGPLRSTAEFTADTGVAATATADTTYTGCAQKGFAPELKAEFVGTVKEGQMPTVHVQMRPRKGDSNLRSVSVLLPVGASALTKNINGRQCANDAFLAGTCAANSKVGSVSATVAITPDRLVGEVFLVKVTGETLPGIGMSFSGRYTQRVMSRVKIDQGTGRLLAAFESIPDLPLTSLDLSIDGGARGPIQFSKDVCTSRTAWEANLSGQGGQTRKITIPFDCTPQNPTSAISWSRAGGLALTVNAPAGRSLSSVRVSLPVGFKLVKSKAKKYVKVTATGGQASSRVTSRTIRITPTGTGVTAIKLAIKPAGYQLTGAMKKKGLKKGSKLTVRAAVALSGAPATSTKLAVKVR
jgi:hypothetical protein